MTYLLRLKVEIGRKKLCCLVNSAVSLFIDGGVGFEQRLEKNHLSGLVIVTLNPSADDRTPG
jgi:hypothetical protein